MITEFLDTRPGSAHDKFQAWRIRHQRGVFLTFGTRTRANLHGARCVHIGGTPPYFSRAMAVRRGWGSLTAKRKLCGPESQLLARAAKEGVSVGRCEQCVRDGYVAARSGARAKEVGIKLQTFRYGEPAKRGQGLRIGTTRYPPRGATRDRWIDYFGVWFPVLAPSARLHARHLPYPKFCASYERELNSRAESRQALQLLAHLATRVPISVGCFCANEKKCHRSLLLKLILREARRL